MGCTAVFLKFDSTMALASRKPGHKIGQSQWLCQPYPILKLCLEALGHDIVPSDNLDVVWIIPFMGCMISRLALVQTTQEWFSSIKFTGNIECLPHQQG
jgi:hypothetical protein